MLRAPMSRMDILTQAEISSINSSSVLVQKYSQVIDRESAYEILGRKVSDINQEKAEEERKEQEIERRREEERSTSRTSYGRGTRSAQNQMVKVLTSATFIRGVFGILSKVMRK
jgi:hypothetical protein